MVVVLKLVALFMAYILLVESTSPSYQYQYHESKLTSQSCLYSKENLLGKYLKAISLCS